MSNSWEKQGGEFRRFTFLTVLGAYLQNPHSCSHGQTRRQEMSVHSWWNANVYHEKWQAEKSKWNEKEYYIATWRNRVPRSELGMYLSLNLWCEKKGKQVYLMLCALETHGSSFCRKYQHRWRSCGLQTPSARHMLLGCNSLFVRKTDIRSSPKSLLPNLRLLI